MTTAHRFSLTRGGIAASLLCVLSLTAAAPAPADDDYTPQVIVRFSDLDPSNPHDALTLYRRIHTAADQVCWRLDDNDLSSKLRMQTCIQRAMGDAIIKIDRPALIAIYNAHHRPPLPTSAAAAPSQP